MMRWTLLLFQRQHQEKLLRDVVVCMKTFRFFQTHTGINNIFNWTSCQICLLMHGHKQNRTELVVKCGSLKHGHGLNRTELVVKCGSQKHWHRLNRTELVVKFVSLIPGHRLNWTSCQIWFADAWTQTDQNWASCQIWFSDAWTQTDRNWTMDTDWPELNYGHRLTGTELWTQTDRNWTSCQIWFADAWTQTDQTGILPFAGSRIRSIVALTPFDEFHRHSAAIIQTAVFGTDASGKLLPRLKFDVNNLVNTGQLWCTHEHLAGNQTW